MTLKSIFIVRGDIASMENKIILPVGESETKAWPETNFLLSVLKNVPFGWDWVLNTHIQIRCSIFYSKKWDIYDSRITFYPYGMHDLTPNIFDMCPMLDKYVIPRKIILDKYESPIFFVEESVRDGYYISTYMDQFFRKDINKIGYHHPNYIYGFDGEAKKIHIMDNFEHGKFQKKEISYDEFLKSFQQINGTNWEASVFLYKLKETDFYFSSEFVREQILDYLYPEKQFCYFNRMACPESVVDTDQKYDYTDFGIHCYEFLQEIIFKNINCEINSDIRFFCIMEDHKYLMLKRYEYMQERGLIKENMDLYEGLKELLFKFRILTNLYLKYIMTNKREILLNIMEQLNELKRKDIYLMNQFVEVII